VRDLNLMCLCREAAIGVGLTALRNVGRECSKHALLASGLINIPAARQSVHTEGGGQSEYMINTNLHFSEPERQELLQCYILT
jgi:hypothetical protein